MCNCTFNVIFEIDGGNLYNLQPQGAIPKCMGLNACLDCVELDKSLSDGMYKGTLKNKVTKTNYFEDTEWESENYIDNITKISL